MSPSRCCLLLGILFHLSLQAQEGVALVEVWNERAHEFYNKHADSIITYGQKALDLSKTLQYEHGQVVALSRLGRGYTEKGAYDAAKPLYQKTIQAAKRAREPRYEADALLQLALFEMAETHYANALEQAWRALTLFKGADDLKGVVLAYMRIGQVYQKNKEFDKAIDNYKKGLLVAEAIKDKTSEGSLHGELGTVHKNKVLDAGKGNFREAIGCYEKAIEILSAQGITEVWITYHNLSDLYAKGLNNTNKAFEFNQKALEIVERTGNRYGQCQVLTERATLQNKTGKQIEADQTLRRAQAIATQEHFTEMLTPIFYQRALALMALNRSDSAQLYLQAYGYALEGRLNQLKDLEIKYETAEKEKQNLTLRIEADSQHLLVERSRAELLNAGLTIAKSEAEMEASKQQLQIQQLELEGKELEAARQQTAIDAAKERQLAILVFALLMLAGIWIFLRTRRIHREKALKLEFNSQMAELETRTLRAQMNPHFIFNALSSIKKFVLTNDADSAEVYLSKFARLIRLILENSRETLVPLHNEIELLENYIQLERLRSGNSFDYTFHFEDKPDIEELEIPSLVLQPFVENAILHGLNNRNKPGGMLQLSFKKNADTLRITIEDNGVGRAQAETLKSHDQRSRHRSFGIDITNKRLEAFAAHFGRKPAVSIIDLGCDGISPKGTRVDIDIPIED